MSRRRAARLLGAALAAVLVADGAVALAGGAAPAPHHRVAAVVERSRPAPAPAIVESVASRTDPVVASRRATRRIAAAVAAQTARRHASQTAAADRRAAAANASRPGSRVGTRTHTVRSAAATPGVTAREVANVASASAGRLVSGTAPKSDLAKIPPLTYLATMRHGAPGFASATARHPSLHVPRNWYGRTSVLPIVNATKKRVEVRLSRRPNESTTWLRLKAVNLGYSQQAILIDISQRRLYVFRNGKQKYSFPVGVGRPQTPTPTGTYFLAFHAPPNGPEYGSVMLETSAHSTVFRTFEGGNDAIIAIHGPIGSDAAIGRHGAAISNGCIRMHEADLRKAARVEDGSPIILAH